MPGQGSPHGQPLEYLASVQQCCFLCSGIPHISLLGFSCVLHIYSLPDLAAQTIVQPNRHVPLDVTMLALAVQTGHLT